METEVTLGIPEFELIPGHFQIEIDGIPLLGEGSGQGGFTHLPGTQEGATAGTRSIRFCSVSVIRRGIIPCILYDF